MFKKESYTEKVYKDIKKKILSGKILKNEKINIDELVKSLGVSKIPIREAIFMLQQEGLLIYKTNVGTRVVDIKYDDVLEILDILNKITGQNISIEHNASTDEIMEAISLFQNLIKESNNKRSIEVVNKLCDQLLIWRKV
ncbi:GntR family transcriptional regulator [Neobacillus sp. D3-1R]|uniref:GntR family transcriptional regulator n=1 Tax=Neobacillus sp. D3-1R TaxID=3445778 RepID=UPI003F9F7015